MLNIKTNAAVAAFEIKCKTLIYIVYLCLYNIMVKIDYKISTCFRVEKQVETITNVN
jgi:hypothetical protein